MTFHPGAVPDFLAIFEETKDSIRTFRGCMYLELLQCIDQPGLLFTLSHWESEQALNAYRQSDLFKKTWKRTKTLFAEKAEAWSVEAA